MVRLGVLSLWIGLVPVAGVRGDLPTPMEATATKEGVVDLPDVFEYVHQVVEGRPRWETADPEGWLDRLVEQVKRAGGRSRPLPVRFAALRARSAAIEIESLADSLYVGRCTTVRYAERSILLVDGNAKISYASDCIIIVRGVVEIAHSSRNIILAGDFLQVGFDGNATAADRGSLLLSGDVVSVGHARGTQLGAPQLADVEIATDCVFINSPNCRIPQKRGVSTELKLASLGLGKLPRPLWGKEIEIVQASAEAGAAFTWKDGCYRARRDMPIVDQAGKPVAAFAGWQASYISSEYVRFCKGPESFGVWLKW